MSITDELRKWAEDNTLQDMVLTTSPPQHAVHGVLETLLRIADRIDAEHQKAEDEWKVKHGQMWLKGYAECHAELLEGNETLAADLENCGWVRLPVDADGEHIHIGDEMEGVDKYDSLKKVMGKVITVSFEIDGIVDVAIQAWNSDGKSWHRAYLDQDASVYRHHRAPTVEDVLREFALAVCKDDALTIREGVVEKYAAKLRLAEGEDA